MTEQLTAQAKVKVTEHYDARQNIQAIDASCIGCGKVTLHLLYEDDVLIERHSTPCNCQ